MTRVFSTEQEAVLDLLRRYGWNSTSFQVLEPGYTYWFSEGGDGVIAYVDTGRYRVAAGAPISPAGCLSSHAETFCWEAAAQGQRVCFFGAGRRLIDALDASSIEVDWLQIGIEAHWDPEEWEQVLGTSSQVASQVPACRRKGVRIREAAPEEMEEGSDLKTQAEALAARWLSRQPMAPLQFLAFLDAFSCPHERRYFAAERDGKLVGLLVAIPVFARSGWLLEDLLSYPDAPNGTSEALIDFGMRALRDSGATYASMGMVALAGLPDRPEAPRHPFLTFLLRQCHDSLNWLYGFRGLRAFRSKFKPRTWEPVYLVTFGPLTLNTVLAVLKAFAGGRLDRFATETAARQVAVFGSRVPRALWWGVSAFLALALVPWIGLLLTCDSQRWFGTAWAGQAWASFDAVVAVALGVLSWYLHRKDSRARALARILIGATIADSWLTAAQAILFSFPEAHGAMEVLVAAVATAAPIFASCYLGMLLWIGLSETRR